MVTSLKGLESLKLNEYDKSDLIDEIISIINTHKDFSISNTFGEKNLGTPQEYEKLIIEDSSGSREFEYYNKAICYMINGKEEDRPVFKVFSHLEQLTF